MKQAYEAWFPNADGLLEAAFRAFDMPKTATADATGYAILRETARLAERVGSKTAPDAPVSFDITINSLLHQGIYNAAVRIHCGRTRSERGRNKSRV